MDKRELYLPEWYVDDHIDELQKAMDEYNARLDDALGKEADAIGELPQYSIKIPEGGVRRFFELYPTLQDYKSKLEKDFDLAKRYYEKKDNVTTERAFYDAKSALEYADVVYRDAKELLAMYNRKNTGVKGFKPLSMNPSYKDPEATKKLANILGKTHTIDYSNYIPAMKALKMNPFLDNAEKYLNHEFGKEKSMYGDYREAFPTITMDDYFLFTKAEFKPIDTNGRSVDDVWQELKDSGKYEEHHSPKSSSKYLVDYNTGEIIRQSDHWGNVASCYWPYDGEEIKGEMQIGRTNIAEMKTNPNYNAHGRSNRKYRAALPKQSENVWKSLQQTIVNYEALLKDDRFNLTEEVRDIINSRILAYGQFADRFMINEIPDSKLELANFYGVSYSIKGKSQKADFTNGNGFVVKKGDEAIGEMMRIFEEKRVPSLQESIKGISEFKRIFANPIQTILGKMIRVKDEVYNKMLRKSRGTISSAVLPTLQDADFVIRESNGSTLYVKRFKNNENEHIYNIVVVNKQNEVEDYISSAHIKTNNNLLNKIKQGAELLIPTKRTNYGILSPSNSTPDANVGNNSEPANKIGEEFSIKGGKSLDERLNSKYVRTRYNAAKEMCRGNGQALDILADTTPQTLEELIAESLSGANGVKLLWDDNGVKRGLKAHLGYGNMERRMMSGFLSPDGISPEHFAEQLEASAEHLGIEHGDTMDIFNKVLDTVAGRSKRELGDLLLNNRIDRALDVVRKQEEWNAEQEQEYLDTLLPAMREEYLAQKAELEAVKWMPEKEKAKYLADKRRERMLAEMSDAEREEVLAKQRWYEDNKYILSDAFRRERSDEQKAAKSKLQEKYDTLKTSFDKLLKQQSERATRDAISGKEDKERIKDSTRKEEADKVREIADQMREFIEQAVPKDLQDDMTRFDFKGVLKSLETATTTKDLEKPMRTVDEIGTYLASPALNKQLGAILGKKYKGTNAKGVAVARAVDNSTRVVMDYAKQLYREMGNNGVSQQLFGLRLDRKDIMDEMKALAKSDADVSALVESVEKVMKAKQDKRKAMLTELRDEMSVETASKVGGYIDQLLDTQEKIDSTIAKGEENISKAPENAVESLKTLAQEIGEREDAGTMSEDDRAMQKSFYNLESFGFYKTSLA